MADDNDDTTNALTSTKQLALLELVDALRDVAKAELAKGPGIASTAWHQLANVCSDITGDEAIGHAAPVVGRQPVTMPPGYKHPIPAKRGAVPVRPDQPTDQQLKDADIRRRADVAAEIERVKTGKRT